VGRSAALLGGLLKLGAEYPYPVRLFEVGASAGLNLRADRYLYRFAGGRWANSASPVLIDDAWRGRLPPNRPVEVVVCQSYDIDTIDATTRNGELTLLSYVWPDMTHRLQRLRGSIDVARRVPATMQRRSAADAVTDIGLRRRTLTVLWHSITWQYLSPAEQGALANVSTRFPSRPTTTHPLRIFLWNRDAEHRGADQFLARVETWPGATDVILGRAAAHGPPVTWERSARRPMLNVHAAR